jgi:acyl-CoA synthetase (AMP-forming)/AMP-acid ligase II
MALSNPLEGERLPGYVGQPLPGVEALVVDVDTGKALPPGQEGELRVKVRRKRWKGARTGRHQHRHDRGAMFSRSTGAAPRSPGRLLIGKVTFVQGIKPSWIRPSRGEA